ncbi:MAG: DUF2007 domain-containing protein [Kofleriaceae bacterium]
MKNRVKIGTCSGPAEAAFVRSVFDAHELPVVINGEMHASALGGLGGFIRLDILVDREDAEQATALLRDVRAGEHAVAEDSEPPDAADAQRDGRPDEPTSDDHADAAGVWDAQPRPGASDAPPPATTTAFDTRRRGTGAVLLLSVIPGFGAAHMSTGAWGRGIAIAALNVVAFVYLLSGQAALGGWLLFGARFGDMFGALWRVWSQPDVPRTGA